MVQLQKNLFLPFAEIIFYKKAYFLNGIRSSFGFYENKSEG